MLPSQILIIEFDGSDQGGGLGLYLQNKTKIKRKLNGRKTKE